MTIETADDVAALQRVGCVVGDGWTFVATPSDGSARYEFMLVAMRGESLAGLRR